jgi:hypothetical protein
MLQRVQASSVRESSTVALRYANPTVCVAGKNYWAWGINTPDRLAWYRWRRCGVADTPDRRPVYKHSYSLLYAIAIVLLYNMLNLQELLLNSGFPPG